MWYSYRQKTWFPWSKDTNFPGVTAKFGSHWVEFKSHIADFGSRCRLWEFFKIFGTKFFDTMVIIFLCDIFFNKDENFFYF